MAEKPTIKEIEKDVELADSLRNKILSEPEIKQIHDLCKIIYNKYGKHGIDYIKFGNGVSLLKNGDEHCYSYVSIPIGKFSAVTYQETFPEKSPQNNG